MRRRLLPLAILVGGAPGCGEVQRAPDASDPGDELGSLRVGCALLLHMDEPSWGGAGSVRDACGAGNHGTPTDVAITTTAGGVRGRAGSFLGTGCVEIADAPELRPSTQLTLSAWVRPGGLDGNKALGVISKRADMMVQSAYNLYLWVGNNAWIDIEGERQNSTRQLVNGRWNQLTVTYDGARPAAERARIYVDGQFDVAREMDAATITAHPPPLRIGCMPTEIGGTSQNFVGLLDEVAIWTRALSDPEIAQWYDLTKPP